MAWPDGRAQQLILGLTLAEFAPHPAMHLLPLLAGVSLLDEPSPASPDSRPIDASDHAAGRANSQSFSSRG